MLFIPVLATLAPEYPAKILPPLRFRQRTFPHCFTESPPPHPQVCLNLNVMMRSATQAAMVGAFMLGASWRLTVVTLILIPVILAITKVGNPRLGFGDWGHWRLGLG